MSCRADGTDTESLQLFSGIREEAVQKYARSIMKSTDRKLRTKNDGYCKNYLKLRTKRIKENGEILWTFFVDGHLAWLTTEEAEALINLYAPENRNCEIQNGRFRIKTGYRRLHIHNEVNRNTRRNPVAAERYNKGCRGVRLFTGEDSKKESIQGSSDELYRRTIGCTQEYELKSKILYFRLFDNAELIPGSTDTIRTPEGIRSIYDVSPTLRAFLNLDCIVQLCNLYNFMTNARIGKYRALIDITDCDQKFIPYFLKKVQDTSVALYIEKPIAELPEHTVTWLNKIPMLTPHIFAEALKALQENKYVRLLHRRKSDTAADFEYQFSDTPFHHAAEPSETGGTAQTTE